VTRCVFSCVALDEWRAPHRKSCQNKATRLASLNRYSSSICSFVHLHVGLDLRSQKSSLLYQLAFSLSAYLLLHHSPQLGCLISHSLPRAFLVPRFCIIPLPPVAAQWSELGLDISAKTLFESLAIMSSQEVRASATMFPSSPAPLQPY